MPNYPRILITNQSSQIYQLTIPQIPTFAKTINGNTQYSIMIPINGQYLNCQLNGSGIIRTFAININGELTNPSSGLLIVTLPNGLLSERNPAVKVAYDQIMNTGLIVT